MEQGQQQDPQQMIQDAMSGVQQQIDAIGQFASAIAQTGQKEAAAKLTEGAKMLQDGLAMLGATPQNGQPEQSDEGETEPASAGVTDAMTGGRQVKPA